MIVKIKNQGRSGYRTDIYGKTIIVERHFSISGASSFKIKSETGRVISTKRSELDEITDFYAFQLDNPVNVLTQDMAREFLNSSRPNDKYKFFIKGVQLEKLNQDYLLVYQSLDNVTSQLAHVEEACRIAKKQKDETAAKYRSLSMQNSLRDKQKRYEWMHAWAQVEEVEAVRFVED